MNILSSIVELNNWVSNLFALISKTTILGLPLDTTLHVLVGFLITYIGLKLKFSFLRVFIFLLIIESIKAYFAALTIEHSILHGMKEFFATFVYPALLWLVRKIKASKNQSTQK
jgi:hypothetical protein